VNQEEKWNQIAAQAQSLAYDLQRIRSEINLQGAKLHNTINELANIVTFCDHEAKPEEN